MVPPTSNFYSPLASSQTYDWKNILVEELYQPPGQEEYHSSTEHTICLSLNRRPARLLQVIGNCRHSSLCIKGDIAITPAGLLMFTQWHQEDHCLRIRIASEFLEQVAQEAIAPNAAAIELLPEFRTRNLQMEQTSLMLLNELRNGGLAGPLYIESLTTVLAVQLLRTHSTIQSALDEGGLDDATKQRLCDRQLLQVMDYINAHLADNIQLTDLAALVDLSQFHFSRLFKQATAVTPHQYVLQQRVERAKQLLKTTDLPIMEIALLCGFSSHSHLGKWIHHYTGMSPKAYRCS